MTRRPRAARPAQVKTLQFAFLAGGPSSRPRPRETRTTRTKPLLYMLRSGLSQWPCCASVAMPGFPACCCLVRAHTCLRHYISATKRHADCCTLLHARAVRCKRRSRRRHLGVEVQVDRTAAGAAGWRRAHTPVESEIKQHCALLNGMLPTPRPRLAIPHESTGAQGMLKQPARLRAG